MVEEILPSPPSPLLLSHVIVCKVSAHTGAYRVADLAEDYLLLHVAFIAPDQKPTLHVHTHAHIQHLGGCMRPPEA